MRSSNLLITTYFLAISMLTLQPYSSATDSKEDERSVRRPAGSAFAEPNAVQVNIYGGSFPAGTGWNNWNVQSNLNATNLVYADGRTSGISANLSLSNAIADNGAGYPVTMCPVEVGRTTSYSTIARYLTLTGLDNAKKYDLEVYASRANSGNATKFSIGSLSASVVTDRNYSNKVLFAGLSPSSGQLRLYIERLNTYNYINGFVLKESSTLPVNIPPVANAGPDQTITLPIDQATLNGSASNDPDGTISTSGWRRLSGPGTVVISNPQSLTTLVSGLTKGVHVFSLTVTDNNGDSSTATTQITVNETPPAGGSDSLNCGKVFRIVILGSSTAMGSGATPIDSAWANKYRRYVRSKNMQSTVTNLALSGFTTYHILCPNGFVPPANRPAPDTAHNITKALTFAPDLIIINLPSNDAQKSFPLAEQQANYERTMALANASGIPVWVTTTQPRNGMSAAQMNLLTSMRDWTYQRFGEKAIDFWTGLASADGTVNPVYNVDGVHVNNDGHHLLYTRVVAEHLLDTLCLRKNLRPVARAGNDVIIAAPASSVELNGNQSNDPDGVIVSYGWAKISGPASFAINNPMIASPVISNLVPGIYQVKLTVTDNLGATATDTIAITVNSTSQQSPVSQAGNDIVITLPANNVTLNGTASFDPDGTIVAYSWTKIAGPASYTISDAAIAAPVVSNLSAGTYQFRLLVRDNSNLTDDDTVSVVVNPAPNIPPSANAGPDQTITQPASSVTLNGAGSADADGTIVSYSWTKVSGPASYMFSNAAIASPVVSNLTAGIYQFRLLVRDNGNLTDDDTVSVTVLPAPNIPPVADAGPDQTITQPASSITLNGAGSMDMDGSITAYQWTQLAGPSTATITGSSNATATAGNLLLPGSYSFQLRVVDNNNAEDKDTMQLTVFPSPSQTHTLQVNIFGGSFPAGPGWNNWNVQSSLALTNTVYSDGTPSPVSVTLSLSNAIADNGASYPVTMCPVEVGRTTSYSTVMRLLTLTGLDNNKKYDLEVYASRNGTGNSTKFSINTSVINIVTDRNYSNKAIFRALTPVNGSIQLKIERLNTYNYINGFTLSENQNAITMLNSGRGLEDTAIATPDKQPGQAIVIPNPFSDHLKILSDSSMRGDIEITLMNSAGHAIYRSVHRSLKTNSGFVIPTASLPDGFYFLQMRSGHGLEIKRLIKMSSR